MNFKKITYCVCTVAMCLFMFSCGKVDEVSQKVMDDIDSIGEVSLDDEALINKTIDTYATLTDSQKKQIKNYATLLNAEEQLEKLKEEAAAQTAENVKVAVADMYTCAIIAEDIIGDLRDLWAEDISYVENVFQNDATWEAIKGMLIYAPTSTIEDARANVSYLIEANQMVVDDNKLITDWPSDLSEEKAIYEEYYDYYLKLYNAATNPSGNYINYCSNTNDYIEGFINAYKKIEPYLE